MLEQIKDAVVARRLEALRADFDQAKRSIARLGAHPSAWRGLSPESAWRLVHGLEASLSVAVATLRETRRTGGVSTGPLRQALSDVLALAVHLEELLQNYLVPLVEREHGLPPEGTRWRIEPPHKA